MKKVFCIITIFCICILPFSVYAAIDPSDETEVVVVQSNTSYSGWENQSPAHYGSIYTGVNRYPISLACIRSQTSVLEDSTVSPTTVDVYVSDSRISNTGTVYIAFINAYGRFVGSEAPEMLFSWEDSIPGYVPKYTVSSSMGYKKPNSVWSVSSPSNFSVTASVLYTGSNTVARSGTADVSTYTANIPSPMNNGTGDTLVYPYYMSASSNNCKILKYTVTAGPYLSPNTSTVRFSFDASDLCKCTIGTGANNEYLHSAIFIPIAIFVPNATNSDVITKLDNIISYLLTMATDTSSIDFNVSTILGYLHDGNVTVISALEQILTGINNINTNLGAVTGNQYASAIQYIEFYLEQVLSNTDNIVNQLDSITSTLNSIANTIGATNMDAINSAQNAEDVHTYEATLYTAANTSIASTVMNNYTFDSNTASGLALVGSDFTSLWSAIRQYNIVYTFSMTLALAFTIIRYVRSSPKPKKEKGNTQ